MRGRWGTLVTGLMVAAAAWQLARQEHVLLAILVVLAVELVPWLRQPNRESLWACSVPIIVGLSFVLLIALLPKLVSQTGVAVLYGLWWLVRDQISKTGRYGLVRLLGIQVLAYEALFLMAAVWHVSVALTLVLVWAATYVTTLQTLQARGERAAGLLAVVWALVTTEAAWIFLIWTVAYVLPGNYLIVPQAALVLGALGYCFGSIYAAQKQGNLSRGRLTEYLLIGLILIWIVIAGTPWHTNL